MWDEQRSFSYFAGTLQFILLSSMQPSSIQPRGSRRVTYCDGRMVDGGWWMVDGGGWWMVDGFQKGSLIFLKILSDEAHSI